MQEISWLRRIPWRRDRLLTPVFLGLPGGSDGKDSAFNVGDLDSIPGLGPLEEGITTSPVFLPGESHGLYSPWGPKELDMTDQLSLSLSKGEIDKSQSY